MRGRLAITAATSKLRAKYPGVAPTVRHGANYSVARKTVVTSQDSHEIATIFERPLLSEIAQSHA